MTSLTTSSLKFEDIAKLPRPGTTAPGNLSFSPDHKILTYLHATGDDLQRQLYGLDLKTLDSNVGVCLFVLVYYSFWLFVFKTSVLSHQTSLTLSPFSR